MFDALKRKLASFVEAVTKGEEEKKEKVEKEEIGEKEKPLEEGKNEEKQLIVEPTEYIEEKATPERGEEEQKIREAIQKETKEVSTEQSTKQEKTVEAPKPKEVKETKTNREEAEEVGKEESKALPKTKVKVGLAKKALALFTKKVKIEAKELDTALEQLELDLIEADVAFELVEEIKEEIKAQLEGKELSPKEVEEAVRHVIHDVVEKSMKEGFNIVERAKAKEEKPFVIAFFGVNGVGKTTTIAKIAYMLKKAGLKVVLCASDTFRAAAIEQLEKHAKALDVDFIKGEYGAHPASVAYNAIEHAKARGYDVVLIDTAGRQEVNRNLMKELEKLIRVAKPDLKIFVGESIAGNALYEQVNTYKELVGIDGIILTKLDLDPKGGTAISASKATGAPILYVTTGQEYKDIEPFSKEKILQKIFSNN